MRPALRLLGVALAILAAFPATAETVAEGVRGALLPYVGEKLGETLEVTPEGEGYRLKIGDKRLSTKILGGVFRLTLAPQTFALTPRPDGTWKVVGHDPGGYMLQMADMTSSGSQPATRSFDGVFDPALPGFTTLTHIQEGIRSASIPLNPDDPKILTRVARQEFTSTSQPGTAPGVVNLSYQSRQTDVSEEFPQALSSIVVRMKSTFEQGTVGGARLLASHDLWRWLVAHPSVRDAAVDEEEMRRVIQAALPLFDTADISFGADDISVTTFRSTIGIKRASYEVKTTGLQPRMAISTDIAISGVTVPGQPLPDWAMLLVPTDVHIRLSTPDLPASDIANELLASFRPGQINPIAKGLPQRLAAIFRSDSRSMNVEAFHLRGRTFDIDASGGIVLTTNGYPYYHAKITMYGLFDLATELRKSTDPSAKSLSDFLDQALRTARIAPYGRVEWDIAGTNWKQVRVNDTLFP